MNSKESSIALLAKTLYALSYDKWFRAEIAQAIKEADDPTTKWVSNEDVEAKFAKKRAALLKRIEEDELAKKVAISRAGLADGTNRRFNATEWQSIRAEKKSSR